MDARLHSDNLDFLDEKQEPETPAVSETGEEVQAAAEPPPAEPPPAEAAPDVEGIKAALLAERRQRQAAEARIAELAKQKDEDADPYLEEIKSKVMAETEQKLLAQKLDLSEAFARDKYADFDAKIQVFEQMVQQNPALYHQMVQQANPADFAYKTALNQQKLQEMGDPLEYEKGLRAKIEAELEAKYKVKLDEETRKRAALPGTLATVSAAGGATAQTWSGPTPLNDLFP